MTSTLDCKGTLLAAEAAREELGNLLVGKLLPAKKCCCGVSLPQATIVSIQPPSEIDSLRHWRAWHVLLLGEGSSHKNIDQLGKWALDPAAKRGEVDIALIKEIFTRNFPQQPSRTADADEN